MTKSILKAASTKLEYNISLETMKNMIATDLGVNPSELHVDYVIGNTGPDDPMDRFPTPRGVVGIKVTHTVKGD